MSAATASKVAGTLEVVRDAGALAARAAEIIAGRLAVARYPFRLVLSGGSTPRATVMPRAASTSRKASRKAAFG